MATAQQDTEITLGTGRMLAIFFGLVLVCAFFFAIGFSLGRKTAMSAVVAPINSHIDRPATVVRPSATKNDASSPAEDSKSGDFSFYKAVGEKNANATLTPQDANSQTPSSSSGTSAPAASTPAAASTGPGYYVQVAAVSKREDAASLVEALKKKEYPAFSANNPTNDKFYHVQVGPYSDLKEAEAMKARLISDGYNPIVKK